MSEQNAKAITITPQSQLKLINNTKLSNDYLNQMDFQNPTEQAAFFLGRVFKSFSDYRYIKREQVLHVKDNYENLYGCDYVMYKNTNFGNKWFYAFINRKEYINDQTTAIYIEIDCYQTWMFEIQYLPSFVSKAHQREFLGGRPTFDNLYPEQLEYGRDYVTTHTEVISWDTYYALICSSASFEGDFGNMANPSLPSAEGGVFDGMPSSLNYYVVDNINSNVSPRTSDLNAILAYLKGHPWIAQCVQSITVIPREVIGDNWSTFKMGDTTVGKLPNNYVSSNFILPEIKNYLTFFPNYKHQKLFAFPYSYIEMTCYNGTQFIIKPEAISGNDLSLQLVNYVGAQPRLAYYINYYNDMGDNGHLYPGGMDVYGEFLDASVVNGNFPQLPVMIDNYMLYMANNASSMSLTNTIARYNQVEGVIGGIGKALTGNIGGGLASAYSGIKQGEITVRQQAAKIQDAELNPPSLAGQTGGDAFNISNGINGVTLKWKTIRSQYADRLEKYFERYGYVQNEIKLPSLTGMSVFNYIQTTNCVIGGNIPDEDRGVIKRMFDNGVTIWHNQNIGNYQIGSNQWTGV